MALKLYNTLTRRKEEFVPVSEDRVTMYVCGPTVYNHAHIGNARPAVVFDLLARVLKRRYNSVVYARNITDVDDKINAAAKASGVPISEITGRFVDSYHEDMEALGAQRPDVEPRVTEHIPNIVSMIERLVERGHAYEVEGHVLFHVPSFPEYGELSKKDRDEMIAGARVDVAPYKRDPSDFVLWKPSSDDLPGWESPWGRGRPGWHIECSTMIESCLGKTIDIHGGGQDLIFPHHENEIAQGTCAHEGQLYCRYWVHNGFVTVEQQKMSKSLGNVLLVHDLLKEAPGEAIRFNLLSAHYRKPLNWSAEGLQNAKRSLDKLYGALRELADVETEANDSELPEAFIEALEDDLNTPRAFAEVFQLAKAAQAATDPEERKRVKSGLLAAGNLLGVLQQSPEEWFVNPAAKAIDEEEIERLIAERTAARASRDFAKADQIRKDLAERGIAVEDGPDGTRWRIAS